MISGGLTAGTVSTGYYFEVVRKERARIGSEIQAMTGRGFSEAEKLAPSLLVAEEYGAVDLLLEQIRAEDRLLSIHVSEDPSFAASPCTVEFSSFDNACYQAKNGLLQVRVPIQLGNLKLGYLFKGKVLKDGSARFEWAPIVVLVTGAIANLIMVSLWIAFFLEARLRRPLYRLNKDLAGSAR